MLAKHIGADSLRDLSVWKIKDSVYNEEACTEAEKARIPLSERHSKLQLLLNFPKHNRKHVQFNTDNFCSQELLH